MTHSLATQIAEVERELIMRRRVYPGMVRNRHMRESVANMQIEIMESVLATLLELKRREPPA
jgi:hypothetical protein